MPRILDEVGNLSSLSAGGQKEVFRGDHPTLGPVVLKKIRPHSAGMDPERIRREVLAVEALRSPNVPRIFEHNLADPAPAFHYLIEEYVDAPTLRTLVAGGRRFATRELIDFLRTMLDLSVAAESHRIVHRDIKPENILLDGARKFWVLDFGISRHLDLPSITATNAPFGLFTVGYAASEQFRNLKREIDIRADLFSIAVVAVEVTTGQNPYVQDARDPLTVLHRIEGHAVPVCSIVGDTQHQLATFIRIMGDNRLSRRPRSAQEARAIFEAILPTVEVH